MRLFEILESVSPEKQEYLNTLIGSLLLRLNTIKQIITAIEENKIKDSFEKASKRGLNLDAILDDVNKVIKNEKNDQVNIAMQLAINNIKSTIKRNNLLLLKISKL